MDKPVQLVIHPTMNFQNNVLKRKVYLNFIVSKFLDKSVEVHNSVR